MRRALRDKLKRAPALLARDARLAPTMTDGQMRGMTLLGVRPDSLVHRLGFRSRDVVRAIDGVALTSPAQTLELLAAHAADAPYQFAVERPASGAKAPAALTLVVSVER